MRNHIGLSIYLFYSRIIHFLLGKERVKEWVELGFWKFKKIKEKELTNYHYEYFFTDFFNFKKSDYNNKKVLDIGCGPRGSLEWAENAALRVGLDTLADKYLKLGADKHQMQYANAGAEKIPFPSNHFDVISSFNSLDHVEDLEKVISEIKRVLAPNGVFLLITDIHETPTICEPSSFSWDIVERFAPELRAAEEQHFEGNKLYRSIRKGISFNHLDTSKRYGILTVKLCK